MSQRQNPRATEDNMSNQAYVEAEARSQGFEPAATLMFNPATREVSFLWLWDSSEMETEILWRLGFIIGATVFFNPDIGDIAFIWRVGSDKFQADILSCFPLEFEPTAFGSERVQ